MWNGLVSALFAMSLVGILYPFIVYPVVLFVQSRWKRTFRKLPSAQEHIRAPSFSVIVPAHNEEIVIGQKLDNLLRCIDGQGLEAEILVVSDGSTDKTCEIAREYAPRVQLIETESRGGVLNALKTGLAKSSGEVVVFSDADVRLDEAVYLRMMPHFLDLSTGGVCGSTGMDIRRGSGLGGERLNVLLRRWVRMMQSEVHSSIGADGSNWAMRRDLVQFPDSGQIAEDLVVPMGVIRQGYRYIYEPNALAWEVSPGSVGVEFERKVRTIAGGVQAAWYCRWMFSPRHFNVAFHYVSWKLAKYSIGAWAGLALISAGLLSVNSAPYRPFFAAGLVGVLLALLGGLVRRIAPGSCPTILNVAWYAFLNGVAPILAIHRLAVRRASVIWQMAPRASIAERSELPLRGIHSHLRADESVTKAEAEG